MIKKVLMLLICFIRVWESSRLRKKEDWRSEFQY